MTARQRPLLQEVGSMYMDNVVLFGLVGVASVVVFMGGWIGFVIRDHQRTKSR